MSDVPEMVERVARALCGIRFLDGGVDDDGWDDASEILRNEYGKQARAAIEAMREPSEAMLDKSMGHIVGKYEQECQRREDYTTWQAMIDAALGKDTQT